MLPEPSSPQPPPSSASLSSAAQARCSPLLASSQTRMSRVTKAPAAAGLSGRLHGGQWPLGSQLPGDQAVAKPAREGFRTLVWALQKAVSSVVPQPHPGGPCLLEGLPHGPQTRRRAISGILSAGLSPPPPQGPRPPRAAGTPGRVPGGLVWPAGPPG